jgi:hypothetical protein
MYIELPDGGQIRGEHLRKLPLDAIETYANNIAADYIRARLDHGSPPLGVLASNYAAYLSSPPLSPGPRWVAEAINTTPKENAKRRRDVTPVLTGPPERDAPPPEVPADAPPFGPPPTGRYTDEWLASLAAAYVHAVAKWQNGEGEPPAKVLAARAGVTVNTARQWVYRARKAGVLKPGTQGRAG